jgi:uncharacterized RDD family membrane protein YckC
MIESPTSSTRPAAELATPGSRFVAFVIDTVLCFAVMAVPYLGPIVGLVYGLVKDALPVLDGQSIGKRAMGIRAVREADGSPLTGDYVASIVRQVSLMIPVFGIIDAFMVFSVDAKRFGDRWARTIVVVA